MSRTPFWLLVVVMSVGLIGCQTAPVRTENGTPEYGMFYTPGDHLRELIKMERINDAAQVYEDELPWFSEHAEKYSVDLKTLAQKLNIKYSGALKDATTSLKTLGPILDRSDWPKQRATIQNASDVLRNYDSIKLLSLPKYRSVDANALTNYLADIQSDYLEKAPSAFTSYPHLSGVSFFSSYPVNITRPAEFLSEHFASIDAQIRQGSSEQLRRFLAVYASQLNEDTSATKTPDSIDFDQDSIGFDKTGGWLGVFIDQTNEKEGALVVKTRPGGLAEMSGLRSGDLLVTVGNSSIQNVAALEKALSKVKPEWSFKLGFEREGQKQDILVKSPKSVSGKPYISVIPRTSSESAFTQLSNAYLWVRTRELSGAKLPDIATTLIAIQATKRDGFRPSKAAPIKVALVEVTSQSLLKEGQVEFPVGVQVDTILNVRKASLDDALASGNPLGLDYVIIFDVNTAKTLRRVMARQKKASKFLAGYKDVPNPKYEPTRMAAYQAQVDYNNVQNRYCEGWGCVAKAILVGSAAKQLRSAKEKLANTPMILQKPVYQDYEFSTSELTARKVVSATYYVVDLRRRTMQKSNFDITEKQDYNIVYRLHPKDRHHAQRLKEFDSETDIEEYEKNPVTLPLTSIIERYVEEGSKNRPLPSLVKLRREMLKDKNIVLANYQEDSVDTRAATQDQRFEQVVVIYNPTGSLGSGFFVKPDVVLTNYHVVEGAKFVEMKLHNGLESFGKVIKSDVRLDLALIKVQTRGKPVTFHSGNIPLGRTVEAIGHPNGLEFSVTRGIVSALRRRHSVYETGGKDILFVQTDTAINPGNSGGPLFLGKHVIGVNNNKLVNEAVEGLGFAIHVSEVKKFLQEDF